MNNIEKKDYCLYKSSICFYKSKCNKGENCKFAHNNSEIEPIKCWFNYEGYCEKEDCVYWHKNNESKEQFYIRTNTKIDKKLYTLTTLKNKEIKKLPIIEKIINEDIKNISQKSMSFNDWEKIKEKTNDIVFFTEKDNEKSVLEPILQSTIEERYIFYTIIKKLNKEEFLNYYKTITEEIIVIEKNNMEYKIIIKTTNDKIVNLLKNEEDNNNNLPF